MPRGRRSRINGEQGSYHIITKTVFDDDLKRFFTDNEKEYFLKLLMRLSRGFYVKIHAFSIMSNHYHILANEESEKCLKASEEELLKRYKSIYGKDSLPPGGSQNPDGSTNPDDDEGVLRLRNRLGNISRFVQELNQTFARFYNKTHKRKGSLWRERFKGVTVDRGDGELSVSAYIDLNPIRAGLVKKPEDYRWCGLGHHVRTGKSPENFLKPLLIEHDPNNEMVVGCKERDGRELVVEELDFSFYRLFVYLSGGIEKENSGKIPSCVVQSVVDYHGQLGIGERLKYRIRNFSEGLAIGSKSFISGVQRAGNCKFIRPRRVLGEILYSTRHLRWKPD